MGNLGHYGYRLMALTLALVWAWLCGSPQALAQEAPPNSMQYPLSIAVLPDGNLAIVDLNLPGVWKLPAAGGQPELLVKGSSRFRQPLNRPRCVVALEDGRLLVGDTATREIYEIAADGSGDPRPLTNGFLGIPNSMALGDNDQVYIADLESRFVYRMPSTGGEPELFAKTNARGLTLGPEGTIWAVTPTDKPLVKLNAEGGEPTVVVGERAFEFPHSAVVLEDGTAYVTDGYAKAIWKVAADGSVEKWLSGDPLVNPVGLAHQEGNLFVADPHAKQVFKVSLAEKSVTPLVAQP